MPDALSFRCGLSAPANTALAIWMARDAGYYDAHGLDLTLVPMAGGARSGPDLSSGAIHAMHIGSSSVVRANANGFDLRTVGALRNVVSMSFFARTGIASAAELRGATVGISSRGSESDALLALVLARIGLTRDDVTIVECGVDGERMRLLQAGEIAATLLNEPCRSLLLADGFVPLVDPLAEHVPWVFTGLVVDRAFLERRRDAVLRFLTATLEGNHLALADAARAKAVLARELGRDGAIVDRAYDDFRALTPFDIAFSPEGERNVIAHVAAPGASHDPAAYADPGPNEELHATGTVAASARRHGLA